MPLAAADLEKNDSKSTDDENALAERTDAESRVLDSRYLVLPHHPNYFLPVSWEMNMYDKPYTRYEQGFSTLEVKFQISVKAKVAGSHGWGGLYAAYTNTSWWQAYNGLSSPFREINHAPELFVVAPLEYSLGKGVLKSVVLGALHQSNGRSVLLSRSWNRLYLDLVYENGPFFASIKPWYRIPEVAKEPGNISADGDDNPDIHEYLGYGELLLGRKFGHCNMALMFRSSLKDTRGAVQLDLSYPMVRSFRFYLQYFYGYGESLIDYNVLSNRLSVGVMLTDRF